MSRCLCLAGVLLAAACAPPGAGADVLFSVGGAEQPEVGGFSVSRVELRVLDEEGRAAEVRVRAAGETFLVRTPLEVPCDGGTCGAQVELDSGRWRFELHVFALDRCGTEARVARVDSSFVDFAPGQRERVAFGTPKWSFDDDGDGIENALELAVCGRVDVADARYAPPGGCLDDDDACCASLSPADNEPPVSSLLGRMSFFAGSDGHVDAAGTPVEVLPFWLDATEVTLGSLERCVAAGACLAGKPQHPARESLASPTLRRDLPAVGLTPLEADELCGFLGKRLPLDEEWDFAAAFVAPGERARFPWDEADPDLLYASDDGPFEAPEAEGLGCRPEAPLGANHRATGRACVRAPLPVGAFPSTFLRRAAGPPLADLAGNAWEWTLSYGGAAPYDSPHVPEGVTGVALRGGGWDSPPQLLENDLPLRVRPSELERLVGVAGFRCAVAAADAPADEVLLPSVEPVCTPPE